MPLPLCSLRLLEDYFRRVWGFYQGPNVILTKVLTPRKQRVSSHKVRAYLLLKFPMARNYNLF